MELVKSLRQIGFTEKEAKIYIALLSAGRASAYTVAKNSGLKKPTVYVILEELIDRGIVNKIPQEKIMQFVAVNPEKLFDDYKKRLESAETEALPELKALAKKKNRVVRTTYFEGINGIKESYKKLLENSTGGSGVGFYVGQPNSQEIRDYWSEVKLDLQKKEITFRAFVPKSFHSKVDNSGFNPRYFNLKFLPDKDYDSNVSINVYKNKTLITSPRYMQGVLIENPDIAKTLKQIFNIVWKQADKL